MFAVLGDTQIDASRVDDAHAMLVNGLVPRVKEMDGFVSGTWTRDRDGSRGRAVVIFEDEASALEAAEAAKTMAPPDDAPITFGTFDVVEVVAQA